MSIVGPIFVWLKNTVQGLKIIYDLGKSFSENPEAQEIAMQKLQDLSDFEQYKLWMKGNSDNE